MPDENELEELTNDFLNDMIGMKGVDYHGRKTESSEELGIVAECGRTDRISGKDVLQD